MLDDRKHEYRLATHPVSFFRAALDRALPLQPIVIGKGQGLQGREAVKRTFEYALFDEQTGPFYFYLSILLEKGELDASSFEFVRQVFDQLVTMDDAARSIPCQHDENEELMEVEIDLDLRTCVLGYSSTLWNTEWGVHFKQAENGEWVCLGIPDWGSPCSFIN